MLLYVPGLYTVLQYVIAYFPGTLFPSFPRTQLWECSYESPFVRSPVQVGKVELVVGNDLNLDLG